MTMPSTEPSTDPTAELIEPEQIALFDLPPPESKPASKPKACAAAVGAAVDGGRRYQRGPFDRRQELLLPPRIEDFVEEDNAVRAIAAYVDSCDLVALGFKHAGGGPGRGQPALDPRDMLKLYLYGYSNRIRSSRRLATECRRNLELIWLLGGLRPGYHSIADFRRDNAEALKALNREFVQLCRKLALVGGERVGIDGSFFKGDAGAASVKTSKQIEREIAAIEREIDDYLAAIERNDAGEGEPDAAELPPVDAERLEELKSRIAEKREIVDDLNKRGETQVSHTDPDARRLHKNGRSVVGYNVQSSIDDKHKLIIDIELTNAGNDQGQLVPAITRCAEVLADDAGQSASAEADPSPAAVAVGEPSPTADAPSGRCGEAAGAETSAATPATAERASSGAAADTEPSPAADVQPPVEACGDGADPAPADTAAPSTVYVADSGYFTGADIAACEARGVPIYVPIPKKGSSAEAAGRFPGSDFRYDADADCYHCPNDCELHPRGKPSLKNGSLRQAYFSRTEDCKGCPLRGQCLPAKSATRKLYRSEHADAVERHRQHMVGDEAKAEIAHRGALCEHPFGTLKRWMGWDHFLVRGQDKASGELNLITHCYNLKRVLNILGVEGFIEHCRQRRAAAAAQQEGEKRCVFASHARRARRLWQALCAFADPAPINTTWLRGALSAR